MRVMGMWKSIRDRWLGSTYRKAPARRLTARIWSRWPTRRQKRIESMLRSEAVGGRSDRTPTSIARRHSAMNNNWALVLAAGSGSRLRSLTTTAAGVAVPKQFCSLRGGASLLEETLRRARRAGAHPGRILTVVAEQHRQWWDSPLHSMLTENVIVQPENKGTATGLLLPLVNLVQRAPHATVLVLPSDHFVRKPAVLIRAMHQAMRLADVDRRHVYLLGLTPEEIDPELGYIVPAAEGAASLASPVRLFVEKPPLETARRLVQAGALCNAFILAASAR